MSKIVVCEAAALHLLAGALEKRAEVPIGDHNLSGLHGSFQFPALAGVARSAGTKGDGWNESPAPPPMRPVLTLDLQTVLLFLERSLLKGGARARRLWAQCKL